MTIPFDELITEYEQRYEDSSVVYYDDGAERKDETPRFQTVSSVLSSRGYIRFDELLEISRWKVESKRNDHNIEKNDSEEVRSKSRKALDASDAKEAAGYLTELEGVGVPVASSILTIAKPSEYAVIDYRALRALGVVRPQLTAPQKYSVYATFLGHLKDYNQDEQSYGFYTEHVREIADNQVLSPREVDMALWTHDKKKA